jgi:hypothetical protein
MHRKEERLIENNTTPLVSEFHAKQAINEENPLVHK